MPLNKAPWTVAPLPFPKNSSQKTNILLKCPLLQKPTSEHPANTLVFSEYICNFKIIYIYILIIVC